MASSSPFQRGESSWPIRGYQCARHARSYGCTTAQPYLTRAIARSLKLSASTVSECLARARAAAVRWPLPGTMTDTALEQALYPPPPERSVPRPLPAWATVHQELKRKGVTLMLLWEEYKAAHPNGVMYSAFCDHYRAQVAVSSTSSCAKTIAPAINSSSTMPVKPCPSSTATPGEINQAQIFVAVLGASNYTYAEATLTQTLPDWIGAHTRAFAFLGGVPNVLVPDNLKAAVTTAHRYEPDLNPTYQDMANHYGVAVVPTRVRKPRDKAKVEVAVQIVERTILAVLRHRSFFSLAELNAAIRELLHTLNTRAFKKLSGSRRSLFESVDKPALNPLPSTRYEYAEWKKVRVHIDYHVEFQRHYYSVPHALIRKQLDLRITATTLECFHKGVRVAAHHRSPLPGRHTTLPEHMPEKHRRYGDWTPERFQRWAATIGPATAQLIANRLRQRRHPEQAYRSCLGILRLAKTYGDDRLEAACAPRTAAGYLALQKYRLHPQPWTRPTTALNATRTEPPH